MKMKTPEEIEARRGTKEEPPCRSLSVQIPPSLLDRLNQAAHDRVVGRSLLVRRLLEIGLDHLAPIEQS